MLLADVAATSIEVGALSSRKAKIARIAALLIATAEQAQPTLVSVVVSWLSGELPQRQIGVGWAALRSIPDAAQEPSLTVSGVHDAFSHIGSVSGKGSQGVRSNLLAALFAAATEGEQTFLRRLLGGELRQGALIGVMADAVATAAAVPAADVRRAAMLGGDLPAVAAAVLADGRSALSEFTLRVGRPVGPMLAQTATGVADAIDKLGGMAILEAKLDGARVQIHRDGAAVSVYTRSLDDVTSLGVEALKTKETTQSTRSRAFEVIGGIHHRCRARLGPGSRRSRLKRDLTTTCPACNRVHHWPAEHGHHFCESCQAD